MKTYTLLCVSLLLSVFFTSCQKEVNNFIPDPATDSIYIKKIVSRDTTQAAGLDTINTTEYFYDTQKRIVQVSDIEYGAGGIRYPHISRYYYNSVSANAPYKMVNTDNSPDSSVSYFTYSNGFIVKDSVVNYSGGAPASVRKRIFLQAATNLYVFKSYFLFPMSGSFTLTDSITYKRQVVNGNMVSGVDSVWSAGSSTLISTVNLQATFDNLESPFRFMTLYYLGYYENEFTKDNIFGKNNFSTYSTVQNPPPFPVTGTQNISFYYTYRYDGYPLIARLTGADANKLTFAYTN